MISFHLDVMSPLRLILLILKMSFHGRSLSNLVIRSMQVTGIPTENSEDLQVLKYEPGQFYRRHHDYIPHQRDRRLVFSPQLKRYSVVIVISWLS